MNDRNLLWRCDACGRSFGRANRPHECVPALPVDRWFADHDPRLRAIYDAVARSLARCGPVHTEAVGVGILFKGARVFAELRPRTGRDGQERFVLSMVHMREIDDPRIVRRARMSGGRVAHFVDLWQPRQVDAAVRRWLEEAYRHFPATGVETSTPRTRSPVARRPPRR